MAREEIFTIRTLTSAYERVKPPQTWLWDIAIGKEITEKTQKFEAHTRDAGRIKAPLVSKREKGIFIDKQAFEVSLYEPPALKLYTINYAEEMFEQAFGKTRYESNEAVAKGELAKEITQLKEVATRTKLWMLAVLLVTGVCPLNEGKEGIKYGEFNKEILSGESTFSNPKFDIVTYLGNKILDVYKKTGKSISTLIIHPNVTNAILKNESVIEDQKNINSNLIQLSQSIEKLPAGVKRVAFLPKINLTIYSYIDWVKDPDDEEEIDLIPEGTIIGIQDKSFVARYGALALRPKAGAKAQLYVKKEVIRPWYPDDSEDDEIQLHSAPLIQPEDAQGWFCAKVL